MKFILATKNKHKREELSRILIALGLQPVTEEELGLEIPEVDETGTTFCQNAYLKAKSACDTTGFAAIADDSGLCVEALDGAPGLYSARYGGEGSTDAQKVPKLLEALKDETDRRAKFVSAVCCLLPNGKALYCEGECHGTIAHAPKGEGGFGYDPVFDVEGGKSFAELSPEQKDAVSHRGIALRKFQQLLPDFLKENQYAHQ